ncbi:hypothetical protein LX36DRAFT_661799 [Colletotrichum falcatum]|nr:hypothetical protein LX36DRAFT_661799 [Colletotrichum falcatum]
MANNAISNNTTRLACDYLASKDASPQTMYIPMLDDTSTTMWCRRVSEKAPPQIDNCKMREACAFVNATGPDSWCEK